MKPSLRCHLIYKSNAHLQQLYAGFVKLKKLGIIDLRINDVGAEGETARLPILPAVVNEKYKVIYDTLDGFNWIPDKDLADNLHFLKTTFTADYYFKRSYTHTLTEFAPAGCKILPLGFNYRIKPEHSLKGQSLGEHLKEVVRTSDFVSRVLGRNNDEMPMRSEDYECLPVPGQDVKILFLTRLWNPDDFPGPLKASIEAINKERAAVINTCRREFGKLFSGGLTNDDFSRAYAPSLIAPAAWTNKKSYIGLMKGHAVCVATTGLHGSAGWKFAEYVAGSRAIVSEPLLYEVPGRFKKDQNYLEFKNGGELVAQIQTLIQNRSQLTRMMEQNYHYYNNYLKPENLILNTLLQVTEQIESELL